MVGGSKASGQAHVCKMCLVISLDMESIRGIILVRIEQNTQIMRNHYTEYK